MIYIFSTKKKKGIFLVQHHDFANYKHYMNEDREIPDKIAVITQKYQNVVLSLITEMIDDLSINILLKI